MSPLGTFLRGSAFRPNAAPALRITLARRLVETQGAPFVLSEEVFTDVASARDELGLLPAAQGPTVVRVRVEGGAPEDREALVGDWLVDPEGGERIARLPAPRWTHDDDGERWALDRRWLEAWETCPNACWMLHAARKARVNWDLLVLAACACARTALPFVPAGEERPLRAIEAAERWGRGEGTLEEVTAAATEAWNASEELWDTTTNIPSYAIWAAAAAADVAADADAAEDAAGAAANAVANAVANAAANALVNAAARTAALARSADLVRSMIPTLVVLRAVAARA